MSDIKRRRIVIVGGGTAGITVAARLVRRRRNLDVTIVEPSDKHYYQPLWTLVGAGVFPKEASRREEADFIPRGVTWVRDAVESFVPDENAVLTRADRRIEYDYLVVAPGLQVLWDGVKGLKGALGRGGVCSNYSFEGAEYTWECLRAFKGGDAVFTMPATAVKCGGAPQKIMYLADDYLRKSGVRDRSRVIYASALGNIFAVAKYAKSLDEVVRRKGIETYFRHNLSELRPETREAVFENRDGGPPLVLPYGMIHVTPPMGPPDFVRLSPLANEEGWVDVDKFTLRHVRYPNIFSLGDASGLPTSKTGAAIRKQAPVLVENLAAVLDGRALPERYDGYTSCPLVTGYGRLVLAEFDYDKNPKETFPFDQSKERRSMYLLKKYGLPAFYWHGMLRGRM